MKVFFAKVDEVAPIVASTSQRALLFPTPVVNQRVQNLQTGLQERWDGTAWQEDFITHTRLEVTQGTAALQDATVSQLASSGPITVTQNGKSIVITTISGSSQLVDGGWISGNTEGLNFSPNNNGTAGKKLRMLYWDGGATIYRTAMEYANTASGLTQVVFTPPVSFTNGVIASTLRVSGGPTTKASNATGSTGEVTWDANYLYGCYATDSWGRIPWTKGY